MNSGLYMFPGAWATAQAALYVRLFDGPTMKESKLYRLLGAQAWGRDGAGGEVDENSIGGSGVGDDMILYFKCHCWPETDFNAL